MNRKDDCTRWFNCGSDGRPTVAGWYEWELWLAGEDDTATIRCMGIYAPSVDFVLVNGRAIAIMDCDYWRWKILDHSRKGEDLPK